MGSQKGQEGSERCPILDQIQKDQIKKCLQENILKAYSNLYILKPDDNHLQNTPPTPSTSRTEECPNHRSVPKYEKKVGNKEERYIYYRGWYLNQ